MWPRAPISLFLLPLTAKPHNIYQSPHFPLFFVSDAQIPFQFPFFSFQPHQPRSHHSLNSIFSSSSPKPHLTTIPSFSSFLPSSPRSLPHQDSHFLTKIHFTSPRSTSLGFHLLINSTNFKREAQASRTSSPLNLGKSGEP
ncbi:hypothetical protein RchiOBHm_Chr3g0495311 [Rosa chinensis]|uniref:Uncharacterized protein n=1 Tax=Rosa chinensis TaxID=74649 RepID=A0A2P6RH74_ROSCH|nr:hypothetical protein RchiOBHm_Chr3g0495311 [Rosa chinensis]